MKTREIRVATDPGEIYEFAGYRVDARTRVLMGAGGAPIPLMPKAFDTLLFLLENAGRTVTKEEIFAAVWPNTVVEENNLTQNISALRKLFGEKPGEHRFIVTVPGRGYRLVATVRATAGCTYPFNGGEPPAGHIRSLAVLPFKRLVEESRNEALELGVADSLILQLGKSSDLVVRPLSATRRFASLEQDPIDDQQEQRDGEP